MTVEIVISEFRKLRLINAYGPQEYVPNKEKELFWKALEDEVNNAKNESCMVLIEFDSNAKVGKDIVKDDPNVMSSNGKYLVDFIKRKNLIVTNNHKMCRGKITRQRKVEDREERAILDFLLICDEMELYFENLLIDEERKFTPFRCIRTKKGNKIVYSDHNMMISNFSIHHSKAKPRRIEFFDFKEENGQRMFFNITDKSSKFTKCFNEGDSFERQTSSFFTCLKSTIHQSFKKIRITKANRNVKYGSKIFNNLNEKRLLIVDC